MSMVPSNPFKLLLHVEIIQSLDICMISKDILVIGLSAIMYEDIIQLWMHRRGGLGQGCWGWSGGGGYIKG